jgi:hypothetical protein
MQEGADFSFSLSSAINFFELRKGDLFSLRGNNERKFKVLSISDWQDRSTLSLLRESIGSTDQRIEAIWRGSTLLKDTWYRDGMPRQGWVLRIPFEMITGKYWGRLFYNLEITFTERLYKVDIQDGKDRNNQPVPSGFYKYVTNKDFYRLSGADMLYQF